MFAPSWIEGFTNIVTTPEAEATGILPVTVFDASAVFVHEIVVPSTCGHAGSVACATASADVRSDVAADGR